MKTILLTNTTRSVSISARTIRQSTPLVTFRCGDASAIISCGAQTLLITELDVREEGEN